MKAADVMTREVRTIGPDATILEAGRLMLQHKVSGLPVVDAAGNMIGIVTEGDFLRRTETGTERRRPRWLEFIIGPGKLATEYTHASGRKVKEIMTEAVHTVSEDASLEQVVHLMERHRIKRLPVVRGRSLVGIVARANLLRAVMRLAHEAGPQSVTDADIRTRLLAALDKLPWAPAISVAVKDGVVQLTGVLTDERQRPALRVAAENIPGVKNVVDDLVWIDPQSGLVLDGS
jgi:CBS-domain-containing membrane protein